MRNEQIRAVKLTIDAVFLIVLLCVPFLRIVTKFGYVDLYLFSFTIRDSTEDLGFPIYKAGEGCPDLMFLNSCDFFNRFEIGSMLFGAFCVLTLVFLVFSLMSSLEKSFSFSFPINSSLFNYLYPLSNLLSIMVLSFYTKLFNDDLSNVQGKFNITYHLGCYLLFTNVFLSLLSVFLDSLTREKRSEFEVRLL